MYQILKSILNKILPKQFLFALEPVIRYSYAWTYSGSGYECSICNNQLRKFKIIHEDLMCPFCGSLSRNRRLWSLLNTGYLTSNRFVLDFSPSRNLYRKHKQGGYRYESSDISGDFMSDKRYDITQMDTPDECFDLIICYHILEHIEKDHLAMRELFRVLKPGGQLIVQTPFKEGAIYEDLSVTSPEERLAHYGQEDHVRIYSVEGLAGRLETSGFDVIVKRFQEDENNRFGYHSTENILICSKPPQA